MNQAYTLLKNPFWSAATLLGITLTTYYPSVIQTFFSQQTISIDDTKLIRGLINSPMRLEDIFTSYGHYYRPFINLSFWLDQTVWGVNAFSFRMTNLITHSLNGVLVYAVCIHFYKKEPMAWAIALLSALIFSLHPAAVESTSWISGRTDLFALLWSLLSILFYFSGRERGERLRVAFGLLFLIPALLSKESSYATPLLFVSAELIYRMREPEKKRGHLKMVIIPIALCMVLYLQFEAEVVSIAEGGLSTLKNLTLQKLLSFFYLSMGSLFFYLKKFLLPPPLTFYITDIFTGFYAFTGVLSLLGAAICLRSLSTKTLIILSWALLGLAPSIYVAVASPAWTRWAERYLYYSLAPLSTLLGSSIIHIYMLLKRDQKKYVRAAAAAICILSLSATTKRSFLWSDNSLLWKNELVKNSHSSAIYLNYGAALLKERRYDDAKHFLEEGLKHPGMSHLIYLNLGNIAKAESDFVEAETYYLKALKAAQSDTALKLSRENLIATIYSSLGHLYLKRGNFDGPETEEERRVLKRAAESFLTSYRVDSSFIYDLRMAARVFIRIGERGEAIKALKTFISRNPPPHYRTWALKRVSALSGEKGNPTYKPGN